MMPESATRGLALEKLLRPAPFTIRYTLLRLFFRHAKRFEVDIGPADCKDAIARGLTLFAQDLLSLPPIESLALLERLLASDHDASFLHLHPARRSSYNYEPSSLVNLAVGPKKNIADPDILRALLLRSSNPAKIILPEYPVAMMSRLKTDELSVRKKNAMKGRSSDERAFWTRSALHLAVAIGDLDLYAETLLWTRRSQKGYVTQNEVLSRQTVYTQGC